MSCFLYWHLKVSMIPASTGCKWLVQFGGGSITLIFFRAEVSLGCAAHCYINRYSLELLMMSGMPLETCWAFNKRWNNKFYYKVASCWLFLLIHTTMHESMNIKSRGKKKCTRVLVTDVFVSVSGRGARKCKMFKLSCHQAWFHL